MLDSNKNFVDTYHSEKGLTQKNPSLNLRQVHYRSPMSVDRVDYQ